MASEEEINLYNEIISKGCCKRCALRYLGQSKTFISFDYPNTSLVNFGFLSPEEEFNIEPVSKMKKNNPCTVCLDLLEDSMIDKILCHEDLSKVSEYQDKTFVAYITFPTCIIVRDHSMRVHLKRTFPNNFDASNVLKINHVWRYSVEKRLSKILGKTYQHGSKVTLHFYTNYLLEDDEMATVQSFIKEYHLSRHSVLDFLHSTPDEEFAKLVKVPPRVPLYSVELGDLKYFSEAIHLIGNYCKYSRQLYQIPLVSKGTVIEEYSVESIIYKALTDVVGVNFKEMIFKASSFDEESVRVLGNGRTFHLQLNNPKIESFPHSKCREIERAIKKSKVLEVKNLKQADKRDIAVAMDSEQLSPRSFKVLCIIYECKNIDYCINAINMYSSITVQQKTPIRFMNKRSFNKKKKKIYHIRAKKVKDNLVELELCVQSGFSVPEFVTGDLGRTEPSLGDIIRAKIDILAMDVVDFQAALDCVVEEEEVVI